MPPKGGHFCVSGSSLGGSPKTQRHRLHADATALQRNDHPVLIDVGRGDFSDRASHVNAATLHQVALAIQGEDPVRIRELDADAIRSILKGGDDSDAEPLLTVVFDDFSVSHATFSREGVEISPLHRLLLSSRSSGGLGGESLDLSHVKKPGVFAGAM